MLAQRASLHFTLTTIFGITPGDLNIWRVYASPSRGKRVLELGAGIGDQTSYYLDRGCEVTVIEARPENIALLRSRYPQNTIIAMDLERP